MKFIAAIARTDGLRGLFPLNIRGAKLMATAIQAAGARKFKTWLRRSKKPIGSSS
jgi:hypothetical protein